jgi:hypothetical protein
MSLLKTNSIQIGQSVTANQNFVWYQPEIADGTIRIAVGNFGSTTDVATFSNDGSVNFAGKATFDDGVDLGVVNIVGSSSDSGELRIFENTDNGTNYVSLKAPESITTNVTFVLPDADGTAGQALVTDGSGELSWAAAGGGGSGLFNTSISSSTGYAVTTSMATAYTAAATAGKTYIVHSIHVTNIGTAEADVTGQFSGTNYSNITFGHTVPVPVGSSVEMLKKPKVLQPSDLIQLQASVTATLHATIVIEEVDGTDLFGKGVDVTASATFTDLHTATANSVLESVLLSNDDGTNDLKARVVWTDGADAIQGYYAYDLIVPADATVEVLEQPKFLPSGFKVRVYSNVADRLEAMIAGKVKT